MVATIGKSPKKVLWCRLMVTLEIDKNAAFSSISNVGTIKAPVNVCRHPQVSVQRRTKRRTFRSTFDVRGKGA